MSRRTQFWGTFFVVFWAPSVANPFPPTPFRNLWTKRNLFPHGGRVKIQAQCFFGSIFRCCPLIANILVNLSSSTLKRHLLEQHLTLSETGVFNYQGVPAIHSWNWTLSAFSALSASSPLSGPWPSNPCFFRFPCFFCFPIFLAFLGSFSFFSKDLRGSAKRRTLALFRVSLAFFQKSKGLRVRGGPNNTREIQKAKQREKGFLPEIWSDLLRSPFVKPPMCDTPIHYEHAVLTVVAKIITEFIHFEPEVCICNEFNSNSRESLCI